MERDHVRRTQEIRVNMTVKGEPADWILEWQERGLVRSVTDAVRQALILLRERFQIIDEQAIRLRTISESDEDR